MCDISFLAGRNCAKRFVFPKFCGFAGSESQLLKAAGAEDRLPKMSPKFAPRLRARAIWKSKSLKTGSLGALLEVQDAKICTTPARESDLEVKIVESWRPERFLKLKCARFAPRCGTRAIWRSKSLKTGGGGPFSEVETRKICTEVARERFGCQNG